MDTSPKDKSGLQVDPDLVVEALVGHVLINALASVPLTEFEALWEQNVANFENIIQLLLRPHLKVLLQCLLDDILQCLIVLSRGYRRVIVVGKQARNLQIM